MPKTLSLRPVKRQFFKASQLFFFSVLLIKTFRNWDNFKPIRPWLCKDKRAFVFLLMWRHNHQSYFRQAGKFTVACSKYISGRRDRVQPLSPRHGCSHVIAIMTSQTAVGDARWVIRNSFRLFRLLRWWNLWRA